MSLRFCVRGSVSLQTNAIVLLTSVLRCAVAIGFASLVSLPAHAQTTVNYGSLGTFTQSSPLSVGGITVTSSGTFDLGSYGLGIVGGTASYYIDTGESALFTFTNGPVTHVQVTVNVAYASSTGTPTTLEAFGTGGASLGVFTYFDVWGPNFYTSPNLSSRVGGAPISAFRISGGNPGGGNVKSITYSTAVSAVPEPGEYAVMGMACLTVCGLILRARQRMGSCAA